ncbi:MAG TPA: serine/threonine-protein kinase [Kofleriaceae bacterium]|nr:serine/threonine-protein kinase [Kofleriaceae bacterium]
MKAASAPPRPHPTAPREHGQTSMRGSPSPHELGAGAIEFRHLRRFCAARNLRHAGSMPALDVASPSFSRRFGAYQLTDCIGRGGTAVVYKGKRRGAAGFEKQVVIKTILPELVRDLRFIRLFREEAKLSAQLFHANIAQVHDFGLVDRTPFLELEYLSGMDLRKLWDRLAARGDRLPVSIALRLATEACRGLAYAHSFVDQHGKLRPIIHRDISPANVMICHDGTVKLLDFGVASITQGETLSITTFKGKLAYMSPEQLEQRQVDRRADVFAFGAMLHELLTGARLFSGATDGDTVRRVCSLSVDPPSRANPAVPPALDVVVLTALARDLDGRYTSAVELLCALERLGNLAATRPALMRYLGRVAPDVFDAEPDATIPEVAAPVVLTPAPIVPSVSQRRWAQLCAIAVVWWHVAREWAHGVAARLSKTARVAEWRPLARRTSIRASSWMRFRMHDLSRVSRRLRGNRLH